MRYLNNSDGNYRAVPSRTVPSRKVTRAGRSHETNRPFDLCEVRSIIGTQLRFGVVRVQVYRQSVEGVMCQ